MEEKRPAVPKASQPQDYLENGLLMCGKCHTPKQWKGRLLGRTQIMPCLCRCGAEQVARQKAEEQAQCKAARIAAQRAVAFGGGPMQNWTFARDDGKNPQLSSRARNYAAQFDTFYQEGKGLLLYGNTGTGKTFVACCIANALLDAGHTVRLTNAAEIANGLMATFEKDAYMEPLLDCDLLVLDNLGMERKTGYMNETLYHVIDGRYRSGKPMLVTTNLTAQQLRSPEGMDQQRLYSRIKERCIALEVTGEDRRIQQARGSRTTDLQRLDGASVCNG